MLKISQTDRPFVGSATAVATDADPSKAADRLRTVFLPNMLWPPVGIAAASGYPETYKAGPSTSGGRAAALDKYEMLMKTMKQFTTRSNCFAVYLTVGYFEVRNPGPYNEANRPILGKELGTDDGTVTRNRYFAVIDRTNLTIESPTTLVNPGQPVAIKQGQPPVYFSYQPNTPLPRAATGWSTAGTEDPTPGPSIQVRIPATGYDATGHVMGYYDGNLWTLQKGVSQMMVDVGDKQEGPIVVMDAAFDALTNTAIVTIGPLSVQHYRGRSCGWSIRIGASRRPFPATPVRSLASTTSRRAMRRW